MVAVPGLRSPGHRLKALDLDDETPALMAWDPAVLRKYNTTGHFRLLNQLRGELKDNPLVRPRAGQSVGEANRSKALTRAIEARQGAIARSRREPPTIIQPDPLDDPNSAGFRDRLNAIELR